MADLPPFFDIVNGFFNRCRGGMLHSHIFGCGWMTCCYKSKIDYLAEIIIIRNARDDMFDSRVVQHCHWWCGLSSVR